MKRVLKRCFGWGLLLFIAGCAGPKTLTLMPTPVIYRQAAVDPFAHLPPSQRSTQTRVFYATNRTRKPSRRRIDYGNGLDGTLHLGQAAIRMGDADFSWEELYAASTNGQRKIPIPMALEQSFEMAHFPVDESGAPSDLSFEVRRYLDVINAELADSRDKEIMIYVHGTKASFEHAAILAAEIDHFSGRDFVGVAFSWPSHQNILYYLTGIDVRRAMRSSEALENFLELLAEHTIAKKINILSYSAGGKVTFLALAQLRHKYIALDAGALGEKLRIGSVVFAAADVSENDFLAELRCVSQLAEQVMITVSDDDYALRAAKKFMGGLVRTGTEDAEADEDGFIGLLGLSNVQIVDVSLGKESRGFDIVGHRYWYRHPWMSSDVVFLMRTHLEPERRGLSATDRKSVWYLSGEYPEKARSAVKKEMGGKW